MHNWARKHFLDMLDVAEHYARIPDAEATSLFAAAAALLKPLVHDAAPSGMGGLDGSHRQLALQSFCRACAELKRQQCSGRDTWRDLCGLVSEHKLK